MPEQQQQHETTRLEALARYAILDTAPEALFDDTCRLAAALCGASASAVIFVDAEREWLKACHGFRMNEAERRASFAAEAMNAGVVLDVADASLDPRFASHPLVRGLASMRHLAGVTLRARNGAPLGALCVMDREPRLLSDVQRTALETLGRLLESELERRLLARDAADDADRLRGQREEIEALETRNDELQAFLSHDVRGPLGAIAANGHFIFEDAATLQHAREAAIDLEGAARQLDRLVQDALDGGTGELRVRHEAIDLVELAAKLKELYARRAGEAGITLSLVAERPAEPVRADPVLLRHVLESLVENALKYAPRGGEIVIEVANDGDGAATLRVRDSGGMPPWDRERLLDKFVLLDGELARHAFNNRSLDLAFCRSAVEAHQGKVWVEDLEQGTAFCVQLPRTPDARA